MVRPLPSSSFAHSHACAFFSQPFRHPQQPWIWLTGAEHPDNANDKDYQHRDCCVVAITQDTIVGSGFSVGITTPINLNPAQSVSVPVVFNPAAAGTVNGSLVLMSNGTTVLSVPLAGTGLAPLAHSVDIAWDASTSATLQGYNVYRSTVSGGPYSKISPTVAASTLLFTDTTPVSGKQYFYVVTSVDSSGVESAASTQVAVTIPVP